MNRNSFIKYLALLPMSGTSLNHLTQLTNPWSNTEKMPVLFVGHGNPMNAILENEFTQGWRNMAKGLQPKAILCISAHWMTKGTFVTMSPKPKTIHDFGGFPPALHAVQYPAPGAPEIASEIIRTITNFTVEEDHEWGLDHGTWSVLIKMFPNADVPVLQMSLNYLQKPQYHYELAKQLNFLRHKGVLIVGSGNIVHNLRTAQWNSNEPYDWAIEFDSTIKELIDKNNHQDLIDFATLGNAANLSIPTSEHYLPMLYSISLQEKNDHLTYFNESIEMGSISMRSFILS